MTQEHMPTAPSNTAIYRMAQRIARYMSTHTRKNRYGIYEVYEDDKIEVTSLIGGSTVTIRLKRPQGMEQVYSAQEDTNASPHRLNRGRWVRHLQDLNEEAQAIQNKSETISYVDLISPIDTISPMLWGNPGSTDRAWPTAAVQHPPGTALLISNTENEAYSALKSATARELDARLLLAAANRPALSRLTDLPVGFTHTTPRSKVVRQHEEALQATETAWQEFLKVAHRP